MKALTNDPWRIASFSVITSKKIAYKIGLTSKLTLYLWNTTEQYSGKLNTDMIINWIYSHVHNIGSLRWLTPSGIKSNALDSILSKHPTFILFTPRSLIFGISPYFDVVSTNNLFLVNTLTETLFFDSYVK